MSHNGPQIILRSPTQRTDPHGLMNRGRQTQLSESGKKSRAIPETSTERVTTTQISSIRHQYGTFQYRYISSFALCWCPVFALVDTRLCALCFLLSLSCVFFHFAVRWSLLGSLRANDWFMVVLILNIFSSLLISGGHQSPFKLFLPTVLVFTRTNHLAWGSVICLLYLSAPFLIDNLPFLHPQAEIDSLQGALILSIMAVLVTHSTTYLTGLEEAVKVLSERSATESKLLAKMTQELADWHNP